MTQALVQDVVAEVIRRLAASGQSPAAHSVAAHTAAPLPAAGLGVHDSVDACVQAATHAQNQLVQLDLAQRDAIIKLIKQIAVANAESWGRVELDETKIGRLDHKIEKLHSMAGIPGVEFLATRAFSSSHGLGLDEFAPFGVIGCITPVTHSIPTLTCNAINMIASGNSLVINPHPSGANCAALAVSTYNQAIRAKFGIEQLLTCIRTPTLETAQQLFDHRGVPLLVVTGGAAVARAALASRKRAIVAGPGNPPVVVDETACLTNAARSIIRGAAYDNNLLCIGEKEVFVVDRVANQLIDAMTRAGAAVLNAEQIARLTAAALPIDPKDGKRHVHKDFVGRDPSVLARAADANIPDGTQLLIGETPPDHPFVDVEQMMPFVPIVRCKNVDEAIERALAAEHGYRHTAIIHSRNTDTITRFGKRAATTIFVANGPSVAGLGNGGSGYGSYSIATPTGEGITTPLTFTRFRRIALVDSLRMI
jgi:aldehyde dehydrogenase